MDSEHPIAESDLLVASRILRDDPRLRKQAGSAEEFSLDSFVPEHRELKDPAVKAAAVRLLEERR